MIYDLQKYMIKLMNGLKNAFSTECPAIAKNNQLIKEKVFLPCGWNYSLHHQPQSHLFLSAGNVAIA